MRVLHGVVLTMLVGGSAHAQDLPAAALASRLAAIAAPVGYESAMADSLLALLPGSRRDRAGNVVVTLGTGNPRRLLACPIDEPGWIVGGVRADGYLTLRRLPGRVPPLFDQQLEGQRITLWTTRGAVPGVVAVRSVHLTRGRTAPDAPFTSDDAFVDVGARTGDEARALGVRETTPLTLAKRPHTYGDRLLGAPVAGRRAACAALLRSARDTRPARGTVTIAFVVEQGLSARGLQTAANTTGPYAGTLLLDAGPADSALAVRVDSAAGRLVGGPAERLILRVRHAGTPVETVQLDDLAALERRLRSWIGGGR